MGFTFENDIVLNQLFSVCAGLALKNESKIAAYCKKIATESDMTIKADTVKTFIKALLVNDEYQKSQKLKKSKVCVTIQNLDNIS